jgi:hypothetical protein
MSAPISRKTVVALLLTGLLAAFPSMTVAQVQQPSAPDSHLVAPPALAKLVPSVEGWTKSEVRLNQVAAGGCNYTAAAVTYSKGENRVTLTLADTGTHPESLMALASPIVTLPADYSAALQPATTIKRLKIGESPAYEMWNGEKMTGEVTVVVGGRFVAAVEAVKGDGLESLRKILEGVDLKALAALK